jgi:hypothetical protein
MAASFSPQKQFSTMKTGAAEPETFEFCFPNLDTIICVENRPDEVVIHATRATFSEERKAYFIRELAAEGFIPVDYKWFGENSPFSGNPVVRWLVDCSWWKPSATAEAGTRRFMIRMLIGSALLWLLLMTGVILGSTRHDLNSATQPVTVNRTHG